MSGEDAVRGFRYQFLCTLEYTLRSWLSADRAFTAVVVDASRAMAGSPADAEIVDFEILEAGRCAIAAQVKSGVAGSRFTVAEAVRVLKRLITNDSDRYVVITNRVAGPGLDQLRELLFRHSGGSEPVAVLRSELARLLSRSESLQQWLKDTDDEWLARLRRADIVVDDRDAGEVDESVRELVRAARHHVDPGDVGWDAAGLFSKYLVAVTLDAAAGNGGHRMSGDDLTAHLQVDSEVARALLQSKDWALHVLPTPRSADVARSSVLSDIAQVLPTPVKSQSVPVCVLSGLSGIGKSSLATAWADDRADAYSEIFWIDASNAAGIAASFSYVAEWAVSRGLRAVGADARAKVFSALAGYAKPWLMVLDNVGSVREAAQWIPPRGLGHAIVTTVQPRALSGPMISEIEIEQMTTEESVQLLSRRLAGNSTLSAEQSDRLVTLARKLHRWPLALEIAAAYLRNCLGGISGIDEFEHLILRSLDDDESIPHGYPNTLVRAIHLSWQQMLHKQDTAYLHAVRALQCAAFTGSRQIPLQVLLAASVVDFDAILEIDPSDSFVGYALADPPAGEIYRAMRGYSLVSADLPLVASEADSKPGPSSFGFSVQMNEIVQSIIRERFVSGALQQNAVNSVSMVIQHWLSAANDKRIFDLLQSLISHAVTASDHAMENGIDNMATALLWGNTATVLRTLGYPEFAVPYLRRELDFLRSVSESLPTFRMQTAALLADVVIQSADDPRMIADEVSDLLKYCLEQVGEARAINYSVTAETVRSALAATISMLPECRDHGRLSEVRTDLENLVHAMPIEGRADMFGEITKIASLIESSNYSAARSIIEPLLAERDVRNLETASLTRLLVECMVGLEDWKEAKSLVDTFTEGAQHLKVYQEEVGIFCRNVGMGCFAEVVLTRNSDAASIFNAVVDLFETSMADNRRMHRINRSIGFLLSAFRSFLEEDLTSATQHLEMVNVADLPKSGDLAIFSLIHRLATQLIRAVPAALTDCAASSAPKIHARESTGKHVSRIPGRLHRFAVEGARPATAILMTLAAAQWTLSSDQAPHRPIEVVTEFKYAAQILGFESEVVEAPVDILPIHRNETIRPNITEFDELTLQRMVPICTFKTYGLWLKGFNAFVDPTVPHLAPRYQNLTHHPVEEEFPVILSVDRNVLQNFLHVPRSRHIIRYRSTRFTNLSDEWAGRSDRTHVRCAVTGLAMAIASATQQFGLPPEKLSEVTAIYPQLRELADLYFA